MVEQAGIDPLWFAIFVVSVVEMARITPPVGFNFFVIQGFAGMDILKVVYAALSFFLLLLAGLARSQEKSDVLRIQWVLTD